ncbi:MAG TPA: helix-turn-helix transcriptional regulator [Streptosporangiaceae bacterium]|nr:helix-turn-helix transcriptional regulator [Streptosporangiaceae bacterium]
MPGSGSPTASRLELGTLLRNLRTGRGWTVQQVAELLDFSPSKVSRLETGHRGASARDIRDLCDLYEVEAVLRQRLNDLAAEGKQRTLWQPLKLPYLRYTDLESSAISIQDYALTLVPGLLQTTDYAREVVRAAVPHWPPDVVEQRVEGRLIRQQMLRAENSPKFEAVVDETVLRRVVGGAPVMRAQMELLLEASRLATVDLRVISLSAGPLPAGNNKFIILRFATPEVPAVVFVEGLTGDLYLDDTKDVTLYSQAFTTAMDMAMTADATRDLIGAMIRRYES